MTSFVLIHGGFHGAWCWHRVIARLQRAGHRAVAPDLPGHGVDKLPTALVTMQAYVDRVCEVIDAQSERVVLVGHSMGGGVITQAAEWRADRIERLVYLSAFAPKSGQTLFDLMSQDGDSLALSSLVPSADQSYFTIRDRAAREVFYGDCTDDDVALAESVLVPQATAPVYTPIHTSEAQFGRIPRAFIKCSRDRAITPSAQARTCSEFPMPQVLSLDTSHSPFLSAPEELTRLLLSLM